MSTTVHQVSPPPNTFLHFGADASFAKLDTQFTSFVIDATFLDFGTVSKGVVDSIVYVMFEIPDEEGTTFDSIQFKLSFELNNGQGGALPFWFGLIATDGVWNNQDADPIPRGVARYAFVSDFLQAPATSHVNWASGSASVVDGFVNGGAFVAGDPVTFGSVGTGSTFEDDKFLTDFQAAFDANESSRSLSRGVPILLHLFPQEAGVQRLWRFSSQNHATEALRPTLTLVTPDAIDVGNIFDAIAMAQQVDVVAMANQLDVVVKPQQVDLTAKPQQVDLTATPQQVDVTAKPQQVDLTARPQEIDVVAGVEDGND